MTLRGEGYEICIRPISEVSVIELHETSVAVL